MEMFLDDGRAMVATLDCAAGCRVLVCADDFSSRAGGGGDFSETVTMEDVVSAKSVIRDDWFALLHTMIVVVVGDICNLRRRIYDKMSVARVSYSGYYVCFPSTRSGFDSPYPHQDYLAAWR